jgi:hypothetical protein
MDRLNDEAEYESGAQQAEARAKIAETPLVSNQAKWFFKAFRELETERMIGMDVGQIPVGRIHEYAKHYKLSLRESEAFKRIIMNLDYKTLTIRAEKRKKEEAKQKRSSGSGAGTIVDSW